MRVITKAILNLESMLWICVDSYEYSGPVELACGPSGQEEQEEGQAQSLSSTLQANYNTSFGEQQQVLGELNNSIQPIVAAGPNQQGFSAAELAARNTQAIDATGAASRNAAQAAGNYAAGQGGGGGSGIESGVEKQIQGSIAATEAGNLANEQNEITAQNYATGRQNYFSALSGGQQIANAYSPNANAAISSNQNAFSEANTVSQEQNQKQAEIGGLIATGVLDAATFGAGGIANLGAGESLGEGVGDFFQGGIGALGGNG